MLKLTKIFPVSDEIINKIKEYRQIIFFEEGYKFGGISEIIGEMLIENCYNGLYSRVTSANFVKQASVKNCLKKIGLDTDEMVKYVERECHLNAET